jgi:hypothetical protein
VDALIIACHEIEERLLQADRECRLTLDELRVFEKYICSRPSFCIKIRLGLIALQTMVLVASLYLQHGWKGFVFVVLTETELGVHWEETDELLTSGNPLVGGGLHLLSVGEGMTIFKGLQNKAESGGFSEAVDWINHHEICIV